MRLTILLISNIIDRYIVKKEVISLIVKKAEQYNRIYYTSAFFDEFNKIVHEKNGKGQYNKWLKRDLLNLDGRGLACLKMKDFEALKETEPKLYCIRYTQSKKNPRVIFFCKDGEHYYLLHCFLERKTSDYKEAIKTAYERIKFI